MNKGHILIFVFLCITTISESRSSLGASEAQESVCEGADPNEVTYFPVPGECSKYTECFNEVETQYECSGGLWWHQEIENCDYPGSYCDEFNADPSSTTTEPTTSTTAESTTITTTPSTTTTTTPSTTTTTAPSTTTTTTTPTTTTTVTTQSTITTTTGGDPRCIDGSTQYLPHPALCSRYIECYEGNSYEMACPPGLFFSDAAKECVNAEESECCAENDEC